MMELAVGIRRTNYKIDSLKVIDKIKNAGFKNVFVQWYNDNLEMQQQQLDYARKLGLNVIFAHLGYQNSNALWKDDEEGIKETKRYINDIYECSKNSIPLVVMHVTRHYDNPGPNEIGLRNIQKIVDYAESLNIKVAVENVELEGYLEYLIKNISNKNFGICFDAGHCHTFFNDEFDFELFKDRIFTIHLHDNDTTGDQHRLPFDGTINWNNMISGILSSNYNGDIVLEIGYDEYYSNYMESDDFYEKAYNIGTKLTKIFNSEHNNVE